jgi:hypothetical protein
MYGKEIVFNPENWDVSSVVFPGDSEEVRFGIPPDKIPELPSSSDSYNPLADWLPVVEDATTGFNTLFAEDEIVHDLDKLLKQDPIDRDAIKMLRGKYLNWGRP